ncbi:NADH:flavin oxidoreductase, partial [Candidatus Thorarchaeota archaeon]
ENRLVFLATHLGYCGEDGIVTERLIKFYRERARSKPGLIIVGGCYTERYGRSGPSMIGISRDEHIKGLRKLTSDIQSYNVPVAAQLYHAGRYAYSVLLGEQAVSASEVPCRLTKETPRALSIDEIRETVGNFGRAARRAKDAGFDAVEILGSAGYIINQFLASTTNKREDEYGGPLKSRARFSLEVIKSVREAVGQDFPVLYRISGDDFVPGGNTLEDNKKLAPLLEKAGIDCFTVTGGWHETRVPQITMDVPRGHFAYLAEGIAEVVNIPVIACNRISSPTVAERILAREKVQLIGMSRGFIADPTLPDKTKAGRIGEIRTCIGCNIGCLDRVFLLQPVTCAINPLAGYEGRRKIGPKLEAKIAVVGAGPAGLEASRILAERGARVVIYDENERPGGLLNLASRVPGRGEFASYSIHMWRELKRLGVEVQLKTKIAKDDLADASYDRIVLATGTLSNTPSIEGIELPHVLHAREVIAMPPKNVGKVVIIGGNSLGCHTAIWLSSRADSVTILEQDEAIGTDIGRTTRWVILKSMKERGVVTMTSTEIAQITRDYVQLSEDDELNLMAFDTVIVAGNTSPRTRLHAQLEEDSIESDLIGSAGGTNGLLNAVHGAFLYASKLQL